MGIKDIPTQDLFNELKSVMALKFSSFRRDLRALFAMKILKQSSK